jgi:hypothetical protein
VGSFEGRCFDKYPAVLPGSKTGTQGGFIQMIPSTPPNPDGTCPAGSHNVGGSPGNAGQPGTGSLVCALDNPPPVVPR